MAARAGLLSRSILAVHIGHRMSHKNVKATREKAFERRPKSIWYRIRSGIPFATFCL
jgi:hypothetical protein